MPAPLLLDLTHTSHTRARTGIQRVTRSLHTALGRDAVAITHDPHARTWRLLAPWENANLAADASSDRRGATWPLSVKLRGLFSKLQRSTFSNKRSAFSLPTSSALLVPEVFSAPTAAALPALFAATTGPRVAVFHDAIALKFPELTPTKTVARFPTYLRELLAFDGIAAVSEDSRDSLRDYWRWLGIPTPPPIQAIPLGVDPVCNVLRCKRPLPAATDGAPASVSDAQRSTLNSQLSPTLLSVGSLEGRKNHVALLAACEQLWTAGAQFELRLIGLAHPQTGRAALDHVRRLQAAGRPLHYDGPATEAALAAAYAACAFTVYPVARRRASACRSWKASRTAGPASAPRAAPLGESARGGGCLALDRVDSPCAWPRPFRPSARRPSRGRSTRGRGADARFRTWSDYATDLVAWLRTLRSAARAFPAFPFAIGLGGWHGLPDLRHGALFLHQKQKGDARPLSRRLRDEDAAEVRAYYHAMEAQKGTTVTLDGREMIMLSSNDYLGLSFHPKVIEAGRAAMLKWGTSTTGARTSNGSRTYHLELEEKLAEFLGREACHVHVAGYLSCLSSVASFAQKGDVILADKNIHSCLWDGIRLSMATVERFSHNSPEDLREVLSAVSPTPRRCSSSRASTRWRATSRACRRSRKSPRKTAASPCSTMRTASACSAAGPRHRRSLRPQRQSRRHLRQHVEVARQHRRIRRGLARDHRVPAHAFEADHLLRRRSARARRPAPSLARDHANRAAAPGAALVQHPPLPRPPEIASASTPGKAKRRPCRSSSAPRSGCIRSGRRSSKRASSPSCRSPPPCPPARISSAPPSRRCTPTSSSRKSPTPWRTVKKR
jgi:glycosyltransferase involved in cell wall biosynthesis